MRFHLTPPLLLLLTTTSTAFSPRPTFHHSLTTTTTTTTTLHVSYGIEGPRREKEEEADPEEELQSYIPTPEPVPDRSNLSSTVLVSGWVNNRERTDQTVFDLLNEEDSAFAWQKIVAFVDDEKFSKKRLISRHARYTGLLDKLGFVQAESEGALPTLSQLEGVKSWVANVGNDLEKVKKIAELCGQTEVENVAILITDASDLDVAQSVEAIKMLDGNAAKCKYTVVAVGEIGEHPEGSKPYRVGDFGTEEGKVSGMYSRDESLRLLTTGLALESAANKALSFVEIETDDVAAKLIRGLREAGYSRHQEIDHMLSKGVKAYEEAIADYKQRKYERENPDPELVARQQAEQEEQDRLNWEKTEREFDERKKNEIEDIARNWAKREYFRKSMGGNMGMTEEEYIESVWERAMFEGDLKYRMMHGGNTDERKELAEFLKKQEAKKKAALKRAKAKLEDQLGGGVLDDDEDQDEEDKVMAGKKKDDGSGDDKN